MNVHLKQPMPDKKHTEFIFILFVNASLALLSSAFLHWTWNNLAWFHYYHVYPLCLAHSMGLCCSATSAVGCFYWWWVNFLLSCDSLITSVWFLVCLSVWCLHSKQCWAISWYYKESSLVNVTNFMLSTFKYMIFTKSKFLSLSLHSIVQSYSYC